MEEIAVNLVEKLPEIMNAVQFTFYVMIVWIFGSVASKGLKEVRSVFKFFGIIIAGIMCLFFSSSFYVYFDFINQGFEIFKVDVLFASFVASIILFISFRLITSNTVKRSKSELEKRIEILEDMLMRGEKKRIGREDAIKIATSKFKGFNVKGIEMRGKTWIVSMRGLFSKINVYVDIFLGDIVSIDAPFLSRIVIYKKVFAGILLFSILFIVSIINFNGVSSLDVKKSLIELSGINESFYHSIFENMPEGCVNPLVLSTQLKKGYSVFENEYIKSLIEEKNDSLDKMFLVTYKGKKYILAYVNNYEKICSATNKTLCSCVNIKGFLP